ncbi:MAG: DUF4387 domain-containing protein [Defluviitaleaceae bacterium]|nr:DUF4387 domain-containing protein [Defluviitaleaceae bacterium]
MYQLSDLADVIRSKNSGPYELTFDIIFKTQAIYEAVIKSEAINRESFAALYGIPHGDVMEIVHFDPAKAIKITIVRPICSGDLRETDVYGAQQHVPLMAFSVKMEDAC